MHLQVWTARIRHTVPDEVVTIVVGLEGGIATVLFLDYEGLRCAV